MLWREFMSGTGCKDTPHNYRVYKDLEVLYMNSAKTKEQIYEYGRKLVDNSITELEQRQIDELRQRIAKHKETLESLKKELESYKYLGMKDMVKYTRNSINMEKDKIRFCKEMLRGI